MTLVFDTGVDVIDMGFWDCDWFLIYELNTDFMFVVNCNLRFRSSEMF